MSISQPKGPLQGLGNYSQAQAQRVERRPAMVVKYQGQRAHIRFHDGKTYGMSASPLHAIGVPEGGTFVLVTTWVGKTPVGVKVERQADARPPSGRRGMTPKIVVRDGRKMITRQPPPRKLTPRGL